MAIRQIILFEGFIQKRPSCNNGVRFADSEGGIFVSIQLKKGAHRGAEVPGMVPNCFLLSALKGHFLHWRHGLNWGRDENSFDDATF